MTMHVDYFKFIAAGEFGPLRVGTEWNTVVGALGEPPLYEPPRNDTPAFARYDDLNFTIKDGRLSAISMHVYRPNLTFPKMLVLHNFQNPGLSITGVEKLLDDSSVTWTRFEPMCDDRIDYYITSARVHLSFGGRRLGAVGV